jgi:hypothetical protein
MGKNIKGTSSLAGKNVQNSESIGNLTADTIRANTVVATNATITNLTNTELQDATTNIATNASNISTNTSNIATNTSNISSLQTSKQDVITSSTNIELAELEVHDKIKFQFSTTNDSKTLIERGDANGKLKFTANNVFFHDDDDTEVFAIKNNGDLNCFNNEMDNVADIELNGTSLVTQLSSKQDTITAGTGLAFVGSTLNAEVTQAELDAKQDTITDSTDIELSDLTVNDSIFFQKGGSSDTKTNITRSSTGGKMRFNGDGYAFKDENNSNNLLVISDSGTCTTTSVQADFFSSLTAAELDSLDNITGNVQTQLDGKQATISSSTALSVASVNLNSGAITNGANGSFTSITLNGSDLQGKIDDKADAFGLLLPLELDQDAFPNPALKLNYDTTQFEVDSNNNLKLTGAFGSIPVTGVNSLTVKSIEINNSTNLAAHFIDFGTGDFKLRQTYNENNNNLQFQLKDTNAANNQKKLQINYDTVQIFNSNFDVQTNDIIGVSKIQSSSNIRFFVDGDATSGSNFTLDLKTNGDADFNGGTLLKVEGVESSNYPTTAILRMASFNTPNTNSTNTGNYGSDSYLNSFSTAVGTDLEITLGTSFVTSSGGIFTIDEAGTYKITCSIHGDNASVNDRVVLGFYISKNDDSSSWQSRADQFGMMYLRDDNFGQGGSCSFTSVRTLALNDNIRIKTKYGQGNNDWQETRDDGDVDVWANITFEKLF